MKDINQSQSSSENSVKKVTLAPHQEYFLEKVKKHYKEKGKLRFVVAWTMGTGKTYAMTSVADYLLSQEPNKKILFISPKSLMGNFTDTVKKITNRKIKEFTKIENPENLHKEINDDNEIHVISNETFRKYGDKLIESGLYNTIIIDEAHYYRNPKSELTKRLFEVSPKVNNILLATGSLINNRPEELGVYLHVLLGDEFPYGSDYKLFKNEFIEPVKKKIFSKKDRSIFAKSVLSGRIDFKKLPPPYNLKRVMDLGNLIKEHFDYIDIDRFKHKLPEKIEENIEVYLSPEQEEYFANFINNSFKEIYKLRKSGVPSEILKRIYHVNFTKLRQVVNDIGVVNPNIPLEERWKHTPKLHKMVMDVRNILAENPNNRIAIYGSFVGNGLIPLLEGLKQNGIEAHIFSGDTPKEERDKMVKDFNEGKIRVLLISPAGIEGLSLYTGTHMLIMDPHPNPEKQKQTEARIIRLNSIPKQVKIIRYFAVPSKEENRKKALIYGVDWSLMGLAKMKEYLQLPIRHILTELASNPKVSQTILNDYYYKMELILELLSFSE